MVICLQLASSAVCLTSKTTMLISSLGKLPLSCSRIRSISSTRKRIITTSSSSGGDDHVGSHVIELADVVDLREEQMPKHVAVIMDGNGRWANNRGLSPQHGHRAGCKSLKNLALNCTHFGIMALTVFAFSTENWKRSKVEVGFLMSCFEDFIRLDVDDLIQRYDMRLSVIGDISRLPESLQTAISWGEESGRSNGGLHLVVALNYGGRYEITEAAKKIARQVEEGILGAEEVDEQLFEQELMTSFMEFPNPDLVIRTSGELRISNFMLWQLAYAELYFSDTLFPDFGQDDLVQALACFQRRNRRFGHRNHK
ncbi:hypothetical protein ACP275_06G005500 [Erythranthe tilingii]